MLSVYTISSFGAGRLIIFDALRSIDPMKYLIGLLACTLSIAVANAQPFSTDDYTKEEVYIKMRDGVSLYTVIYRPDVKRTKFPVLIKRTTYGCAPYGPEEMPETIMHNPDLVAAGYIFVHQDVRGRWMSDGLFENTKPPYSFWDQGATDEVTDSWDTYEWLRKNLKHFNGNIGQYGNSYLGFTSLVGSVTGHPSLKAVLAMAPVTNFFFEDFNRYGLYGLNYAPVMDVFGVQKTERTSKRWYQVMKQQFVLDDEGHASVDYYDFFLDRLALKNLDDVISPSNFFWKNIKAHPHYDAYRDQRNWLNYLNKTSCQTMIVGGWNDEQNLYGIVNSYKTLNALKSTSSKVQWVMGPWSHGHPKRRDEQYYLGDIFYGNDFSKDYQEEVEFKYFEYHLKGKGTAPDFKAKVFDTGAKTWLESKNDPFTAEKKLTYYLGPEESLVNKKPVASGAASYLSNPKKPVPFTEKDEFHPMAPKYYMTADQRFASKRPDVLTYVSDPLDDDLTVLGEIKAFIEFATDHQDADLYVKVIDVFPYDREPEPTDLPDVKMTGYQHLVRCGYIRGRYHQDFSNPVPLEPHQKTSIQVPMLEVFHTFKKGHRIMVQIQSSWFPLFDLNPQKYVKDIYQADKSDFQSAIHKVYYNSRIVLPIKE